MTRHSAVEDGIADLPCFPMLRYENRYNNASGNANEIYDNFMARNSETLPLHLMDGPESSVGAEHMLRPILDGEFRSAMEIPRHNNRESRNEGEDHALVNQSILSDEYRQFLTPEISALRVEDSFLSDIQRILSAANQTNDAANTDVPQFAKKPRYAPWQIF